MEVMKWMAVLLWLSGCTGGGGGDGRGSSQTGQLIRSALVSAAGSQLTGGLFGALGGAGSGPLIKIINGEVKINSATGEEIKVSPLLIANLQHEGEPGDIIEIELVGSEGTVGDIIEVNILLKNLSQGVFPLTFELHYIANDLALDQILGNDENNQFSTIAFASKLEITLEGPLVTNKVSLWMQIL